MSRSSLLLLAGFVLFCLGAVLFYRNLTGEFAVASDPAAGTALLSDGQIGIGVAVAGMVLFAAGILRRGR